MRETWVRSLGREDALEKEMAIHSSTIAWKIPWTEEPGRLQSVGSQRVRYDWATSLSFPKRKWCTLPKDICLGCCSVLLIMNTAIAITFLNRFFCACGQLWYPWQKKVKSEVTQSCSTLWDPTDCSLPGSSIHGIFQARILEWVAISFSRRSSLLRDWTWVSHIVGRCFTVWATREAQKNP